MEFLDIELKVPPTDVPRLGPCAGKTDMFFPPPRRTRADIIRQQEAVALCRSCPQQRDCLRYALHYERFGIWGGTTERQRTALRREYKISLKERTPK